MITQFAQLFETHTRSLVWLFPVFLPLFIIIFSPYFVLGIGAFLYARERLTKKPTYIGLTLLSAGGLLLAAGALQYIPAAKDLVYPWGNLISLPYLVVAAAFLVVGLWLRFKYGMGKKRRSVSNTLLTLATIFAILYLIEFVGIIGAANSK